MAKHGLLHQETSVTPFTLGIMHRGFHQQLHHKYLKTIYFKNSFIAYKNFQVDWYGDLHNFRGLGDRIIELMKKNKNFSKNLLRDTIKTGELLMKENKRVEDLNLGKLSNKQLAAELKNLYLLGNRICDLGQMAVFSDLRHYKLSTLLKNIIKEKKDYYKLRKPVNEYYSTLVTPHHDSLSIIEKKKILELADKLNIDLVKTFKSKSAKLLTKYLKSNFPDEYKRINKLHQHYKWLTFGQLGPVKSLQSSLQEYKDLLKTGRLKNQLNKIKKDSRELTTKQTRYTKELHLNSGEKRLFKGARDFSYNKIYRYNILMYNFYNLDKLLREIVKRTEHSLKELRFMSWEEIVSILIKDKKVSHNELKKRQHFCVTVVQGKGIKYLTGSKAKLYIKRNVAGEEIDDDIMVVHGSVAFVGRVQGIARIVNSKNDIKKVKRGDIIVSIQTNPDLLPAMKKAAAYVTDVGGITSHAAIVAREMKKPCIIGTKIATKVFKDGDKVDVDATKGDIKKMIK